MHPPTYAIYGKIIVDNIRLRDGRIIPGRLGGGGPQASFGARLWADDVALLTRSGTDLEAEHEHTLHALGLDLSGWMRHADLPTPRGLMQYDDDERLFDHGIQTSRDAWFALLGRPMVLSERHRAACGIHLISEFGAEPMAHEALALRQRGVFVSLEPIFDDHSCSDPATLLDLCRQVDAVTPDWPAASALAGSDDLATVADFWANLGPSAVAIRRGSLGSIVWDRRHATWWNIATVPIEVVDPTGAGNAYGGGWFVTIAATGDAREAGCRATVSAALILTAAGMPPLDAAARERARHLLATAHQRATPLFG